jgi:DnaJ-class molecular chaperone
VWVVSLYVKPFGACPDCHGTGNLIRGKGRRQRAVTCPRCKGLGRRQRPGSRTVHQLGRRVRRELEHSHRERQRAINDYPEE